MGTEFFLIRLPKSCDQYSSRGDPASGIFTAIMRLTRLVLGGGRSHGKDTRLIRQHQFRKWKCQIVEPEHSFDELEKCQNANECWNS